MSSNKFPAGWDEDRIRGVVAHYDAQTEDEGIAEDEAAFADASHAAVEVPIDLVPAVRELIVKHKRSA